MFYNARWYDPALGRFAQADSIVPGGVQGLDRYAYVNNDPVRYTDPSGHISCDELPEGECGVGNPTPRPNDLSNVPGGKTGISGNDFYNWYRELWNTPGWWWEVFGQDADGFTIWDAFVVIYVFEANGHWSESVLSEAAIRDANAWCQHEGGAPCTTGGYINHFAYEYQSAGNWVRAGIPPNPYDHFSGDYPKFTEQDAQSLQNVSASFTNHPAEWNLGCTPSNVPCGWANNTSGMYSPDVRNKLQSKQNRMYVYSPKNDLSSNPWFIPSACVVNFWLIGQIDAICDPVR
jgi:hypothetical protein